MSEPRGKEIHSQTIPELLFKLHRQQENGRLTLRRGVVEKRLLFRDGTVVFASSNDRDDRLIQNLLRRGTLPLPELLRALEVSLRSRRRLGEVLLEQEQLSHAGLVKAIQDQITDLVCSAFQWTSGTWEFDRGTALAPESITLPSRAPELILEGMRRIESWARVQEAVGGLNTEYRATNEASALIETAMLSSDEKGIVTYCEETRTLEEICDEIPLNDFLICKLVWGLVVVGALMKA